jgi:hypothetical protein
MDVPLLWRKASRDVTMNSVVDSAGLGGDVCPPSKVKLSLAVLSQTARDPQSQALAVGHVEKV